MEFVEPHSTILVLNSSYEPLNFVSWKRAIVLLIKEKAKLISKRTIRLINFVKIPSKNYRNYFPTKSLIHKRDDFQCQYCGAYRNLTIDHVIPKSKGGGDTWDNLVCCCYRCNIKKGDLLLHETDMTLYTKPHSPLNPLHLKMERSMVSEWKDYLITSKT